MKKTLLIMALAVLGIAGASAQNCNQQNCSKQAKMEKMAKAQKQNIGPAVAGSMDASKLPDNAKKFLKKYFANQAVLSVQNDYKDREYEVKLADGSEVEFDYAGNWIEVEAPDGATLPSSTLQALMPESVVTNVIKGDVISQGGVSQFVESVTTYPDFYIVSTVNPSGKTKTAIEKSTGETKNIKPYKLRDNRGDKGKMRDGKQDMRRGYAQDVNLRLDRGYRQK